MHSWVFTPKNSRLCLFFMCITLAAPAWSLFSQVMGLGYALLYLSRKPLGLYKPMHSVLALLPGFADHTSRLHILIGRLEILQVLCLEMLLYAWRCSCKFDRFDKRTSFMTTLNWACFFLETQANLGTHIRAGQNKTRELLHCNGSTQKEQISLS